MEGVLGFVKGAQGNQERRGLSRMKARKLYARLDRDFGIKDLNDDWSFMRFNNYITSSFKRRYMGIVLDNAGEVKKVYTAVFPDLDILDKVLAMDQTDILLFAHHAMGYDPTISGFPFYDIPDDYLRRLKQKRISFYMLHAPLDKNSEFSTSVNLAKNLEFEIIGEFCEYDGMKVGVLCKTELKTVIELVGKVKSIVGHEVRLLANGDNEIHEGRVAVAAGGGNSVLWQKNYPVWELIHISPVVPERRRYMNQRKNSTD